MSVNTAHCPASLRPAGQLGKVGAVLGISHLEEPQGSSVSGARIQGQIGGALEKNGRNHRGRFIHQDYLVQILFKSIHLKFIKSIMTMFQKF